MAVLSWPTSVISAATGHESGTASRQRRDRERRILHGFHAETPKRARAADVTKGAESLNKALMKAGHTG